ncbi:MAG TPA: hypothetical protein VMH90_01655, partial [Thermoplasmata archaeon]|nr:hypothetical protein [Thermoplasmata archaeon]
MARKVSLHLYVTLDGYVDFPTYPGSDHPFPDEPEFLAEEMWVKRWWSIDSLLFDPLTYDQWADFWPMSKRTPGEHPWIRQMSEFAERARKVVLSGRPGDTTWANTRVLEGEVAPAMRQLQSQAGGDLAVVAPGLGLELMRHGLINE